MEEMAVAEGMAKAEESERRVNVAKGPVTPKTIAGAPPKRLLTKAKSTQPEYLRGRNRQGISQKKKKKKKMTETLNILKDYMLISDAWRLVARSVKAQDGNGVDDSEYGEDIMCGNCDQSDEEVDAMMIEEAESDDFSESDPWTTSEDP